MSDAPIGPEFRLQATGWSASIRAAEFFACSVCGACIVERAREDSERMRHSDWHRKEGK